MSQPLQQVFSLTQGPVIKTGFRFASTHVPELQLFMRRLEPEQVQAGTTPVLFVHGATFASYLWDIDHPGYSWMDHVARQGRTAYGVDIRGYGGSSKLEPVLADPLKNQPYARGAQAIEDIDDAVELIRAQQGVDQVDLVGGSWGTITCGMYAAGLGRAKVRRLILYAPIWCTPLEEWLAKVADPADPNKARQDLGAYRWAAEEALRARWDREIVPQDKNLWRPEECFQALMQEAFSWDPEGAAQDPPAFRAPNGTLVDIFETLSGRPLYDPAAIIAPTMLVRAANDIVSNDQGCLTLFGLLGSEVKRYILIGDGSHFFVGEKNRWQLFEEARLFFA